MIGFDPEDYYKAERMEMRRKRRFNAPIDWITSFLSSITGADGTPSIPPGALPPIDHGDLTGLLDDDHTQYQKESEKDQNNGYAGLNSSGLVPEARIDAAVARDSEVTSAISAHAGLSDPHTGYQKESEKGAASGYASLDSGTHVPQAELGSGSGGAGTKVLYDDQTFKTPAAGSAGHTIQDEGSNLTARSNLNFTGDSVIATDDAGNDQTDVTINHLATAVHSVAQPVAIHKNGTIVGTRKNVNLIEGSGVTLTVSDDAGDDEVDVTITASGGSAHVIEEETTPLAQRSNLSFQGAGVVATDDAGNDRTVVTIPGAASYDYILIEDQKTSGTAGGTFTSGAWRTHDLNTEVADTGSYASVASNQFTLLAGTYCLRAWAVGYLVQEHATRLQNVTDATTVLNGSTVYTGADDETPSLLVGRFTLSGTKTLELQHRCGVTRATNGFGVPAGASFTVDHELYASVELWREP